MNGKELYLKRVSRWLPRGMRADVIDELDAAIDECLAGAPAGADENEVYDRLRRDFGHPAVAATRFVDGRPVVSAGLAHAYWRVLFIVCPVVVAIQVAVASMGSGDEGASTSIIDGLLSVLGHLFMAVGVITAVFVFIDGGWRTLCRWLGLDRSKV